ENPIRGPGPAPPPGARRAIEAQHDDLGGHGLRGPGEHRKTCRHSHLLRTARGISDHAAADRAAEILPPELLSGCGIERMEVAAQIAEEDDPSCGRCYSSHDGVV